ncbi:hypothetical protein [Streptosporangium vulgare]|uniref:Uncharacterized protein n=1 Tax=Streptosporangium vulgare TaxID=46190 RepID=A0ABV5TEI6_9ACTN
MASFTATVSATVSVTITVSVTGVAIIAVAAVITVTAVTLTVTVPTGRRRVSGGVRTVTPRYQSGWRWWTHERSGHRGLGGREPDHAELTPAPVRRSWKP